MDRNTHNAQAMEGGIVSLSARRAWIEIAFQGLSEYPLLVALRKESVDRNIKLPLKNNTANRSLSARRAWIEIGWWRWLLWRRWGRSPQGERG